VLAADWVGYSAQGALASPRHAWFRYHGVGSFSSIHNLVLTGHALTGRSASQRRRGKSCNPLDVAM